MEQLTEYWLYARQTFPVLLNFAVDFISALIIFFGGIWVARRVRKRLSKTKDGSSHVVDSTLRPVIATSIFYAIVAMTIYAVLTKLGIPATSLLAIFGAAGLAIGLALKDTLSNVASGVMLLFLRPLKVGESVNTSSYAGTVQEIGLFATSLKNSEGIYIYVPNSEVWRNRLQNFSRHNERKFIESLNVSYKSDLKKAQALLIKVMQDAPDILNEPAPPECYVMGFGENAITLSCRCWLPADDWLQRSSELRIAIKDTLDAQAIEIALPQRVIINKNG